MLELSKKIEFEIHITVNPLKSVSVDSFTEICHKLGGKPLLIELSKGIYCQQLMMTKCLSENNLEQILRVCKNDCEIFTLKAFVPNRIKVEVDADFADLFKEKNQQNYFEWHGKTELKFHKKLLEICGKHNAHLSKNSLKGENNARFITLRETGKKSHFENRISLLTKDLHENGWEILKQQSEFCIFDSNISLDKGWLET